MTVRVWFNPGCSKCRGTMELLNERGVEADIREYLTDPPTEDEIREILGLLGVGARAIVRTNEAVYKELDLEHADDDALIAAMAAHPILIQRPIVIANGRATIGRPPEKVLSIL